MIELPHGVVEKVVRVFCIFQQIRHQRGIGRRLHPSAITLSLTFSVSFGVSFGVTASVSTRGGVGVGFLVPVENDLAPRTRLYGLLFVETGELRSALQDSYLTEW